MFIIWSGFGFLALLLPFVTVLLTVGLASAMGGSGYNTLHHWPAALGLLLGAGAIYLTSQRLESPGRALIDPATGQTVIVQKRHTLFWIPLRIWAMIVGVFGLLYLL